MYASSTQDSYSYGAIQYMPFQHKIPILMEQFNVCLFNTRFILLWSNSMYAFRHKIPTLMEQVNVCLVNTRLLLLWSNSMYASSTQDSYSYGAIQCMPFQHKIPTLMEQFNVCLFNTRFLL